MESAYSQNSKTQDVSGDNSRICPSCGFKTLKGMAGGVDAHCANCGYKDPCCYD